MSDVNTIIDKSFDHETGELLQFTIIDDSGQPQLIKANSENILLYDPLDDLPLENGLYGFFEGEDALLLSEDPEIVVAPTSNEYCYLLKYNGRSVETTPKQSEDVLAGVKDAIIDEEMDNLLAVFDQIVSNQVRRPVMNALLSTFDQSGRIDVTDRGWLIDDFYLVNWEASMYLKHNDPDESDYKRGGGSVRETDRAYEFIQLSMTRAIELVEVTVGGDEYRLSEREMLFLSKVKWMLNRRYHHPDQSFWKWSDHHAAVDWQTGEPETSHEDEDEPDLDKFEL